MVWGKAEYNFNYLLIFYYLSKIILIIYYFTKLLPIKGS